MRASDLRRRVRDVVLRVDVGAYTLVVGSERLREALLPGDDIAAYAVQGGTFIVQLERRSELGRMRARESRFELVVLLMTAVRAGADAQAVDLDAGFDCAELIADAMRVADVGATMQIRSVAAVGQRDGVCLHAIEITADYLER